MALRNASFDGAEMQFWVKLRHGGKSTPRQLYPKSRHSLALQYLSKGAMNDLLHRRKAASLFAVGPP